MTAKQNAPPRSKIQSLRQSGTLNPGAKKVQDGMFLEEEFFDPQDLIQVKYESCGESGRTKYRSEGPPLVSASLVPRSIRPSATLRIKV